jgi:hypothetical protein
VWTVENLLVRWKLLPTCCALPSPRARRPLLSVVPCAPLPYPSSPSASSPDSERVPKLSRDSGGAQGEAGGSVSPGTLPAADVGAMPTRHRNSLGVGRVARRARLVIKPNENRLPRLTLKAGHKEGLPTSPTAACGAPKRRLLPAPLLLRNAFHSIHTCILLDAYSYIERPEDYCRSRTRTCFRSRAEVFFRS